MDQLIALIADRQPKGVDVKCAMSTVGKSMRADVHYHTNGWVVRKTYQIVVEAPVLAIILRSFSLEPDA